MAEPSHSGGTSRRGLLAGAIAIGAGGGALWYLFGRNGDGPDAVAAAFIERIDAGEFSEADALLHPDNPIGGAGDVVELLSVLFGVDDIISAVSMTVTERQVKREDNDEATVALTVVVDLFLTEFEEDIPLEMRTHEGQWYVWNLAI